MAVNYLAISSSLGSCCSHRSLPARAPLPLRSHAVATACSCRRRPLAHGLRDCEHAPLPLPTCASSCRRLATWARTTSTTPLASAAQLPPVPDARTCKKETTRDGSKHVRPASQGNIPRLRWFHSCIHEPNILENWDGMAPFHPIPYTN